MEYITPKLAEIMDCLYRVAIKAIIINNGKLLVVQEEEGWYGLPGGGLEYSESIHENLYREIQEELGIQIETLQIDPDPVFVTNRGVVEEVPRVTLYYRVRLQAKNKQPIAAELAQTWVGKAEFANLYLQPNVRPAKDFLLNQL